MGDVEVLAPALACARPTKKYPDGRTGTDAGYQAHRQAAEAACTPCKAANPRVDPATKLAYDLRHRNGITLDDYDRILAEQGGGCAICGTTTPAGQGRFHVDHDHTCCPGEKSCAKCVRGLLCNGCNLGLGNFCDDVDRLTAAASYLMTRRGA